MKRDRVSGVGPALLAGLLAVLGPYSTAMAQELPGCVLTGSMTMTIGGKPALRLSDVAQCPPDSYEIISSITIDGQPMVHFKPVHFGKTRCAAMGDPTVMAEDKASTALGSVHCETN